MKVIFSLFAAGVCVLAMWGLGSVFEYTFPDKFSWQYWWGMLFFWEVYDYFKKTLKD